MRVASFVGVTPKRVPPKIDVGLLHDLLDRCRRWDDAQTTGVRSMSAPERAALLCELEALVAEHAHEKNSTWQGFRRWFSSTPSDAQSAEQALLQAFERVCDHALPLHESSVLLRQYGALRRAAHQSESGRSGRPAPPPRESRRLPWLDLGPVAP
jgi:hypothetical protein